MRKLEGREVENMEIKEGTKRIDSGKVDGNRVPGDVVMLLKSAQGLTPWRAKVVAHNVNVVNVEKDRGVVAATVLERGRKSVSQIESNARSVAAFLQVRVVVADMPEFMQVHAFRCARRTYDSLEKFSYKYVAHNMKKEFDRAYGRAWHCIAGPSFGSFVTHSKGCFLYFSMERIYILVFKTKEG